MSADKQATDTRFLGRPVLLAMISCQVAGLFFLPLMPVLLGALALELPVSSVELGVIGSLQLGCTAVGALFLTKLAARYSCRTLAICAIAVELAANIACVLSDSIIVITALRGVSGIAQGALLSAAGAGAAISGKTERFFVYYNVALAMFAVAGLTAAGWAIGLFGYSAGFALFVVVDLLALALIYRGFPEFRIERALQGSDAVPVLPTGATLKIWLALILFGVALGSSQTFIGRLGESHGASIQTIGASLGAGWCLAIATPFLVLPLIRRWGGVMSLVVAYLFVTLCAITLSLTETLTYFLIAAALFTPTAVFVEPLLFGILGAIDRSGQLAALGPAALSVGSGVGPFAGGIAVTLWGLSSIGFLAGACFLLSVVVLLPLAISAYRNRSG